MLTLQAVRTAAYGSAMARHALIKQYLDAGIQFTQMTRERAEAIVKDLVEDGEVRRKQASRMVDDLVERSRGPTSSSSSTRCARRCATRSRCSRSSPRRR